MQHMSHSLELAGRYIVLADIIYPARTYTSSKLLFSSRSSSSSSRAWRLLSVPAAACLCPLDLQASSRIQWLVAKDAILQLAAAAAVAAIAASPVGACGCLVPCCMQQPWSVDHLMSLAPCTADI
jgi:hypothetical protein